MTCMPPVFEDRRRRGRRRNPFDGTMSYVVGAGVALSLLALDTMGLRTRLWRTDFAALGSVLFVALFAFAFGGLAAAAAKRRAGRDDDDEPRGGRRALAYATIRAGRQTAGAAISVSSNRT